MQVLCSYHLTDDALLMHIDHVQECTYVNVYVFKFKFKFLLNDPVTDE